MCGVIVVALLLDELELEMDEGVSVIDPREITPLEVSPDATRGDTFGAFLDSVSLTTLFKLSKVRRLRFACLQIKKGNLNQI